jgi:hypothetical protein
VLFPVLHRKLLLTLLFTISMALQACRQRFGMQRPIAD